MLIRSRLTPGDGLSPRVRGNRGREHPVGASLGSIPACAGEPAPEASSDSVISVYPRVCGGTHSPFWRMTPIRGLSPRVRGNRDADPLSDSLAGSIPACAGEPHRRYCRSSLPGVYPRVCGGTMITRWVGALYRGLSPRVRGNLQNGLVYRTRQRSIPACAGEPLRRITTPLCGQVYPRVCGGTVSRLLFQASGAGLSPRVRGNPFGCFRP